MKVFVTGASGFIGSAIVRDLIEAGHQVRGLARSDASAAQVASAGAEVQYGSLDDLDSLRSAAAASDGVIHTAFMHDFANFARAAEMDMRAIETIGAALEGSNRPFVVTAGILQLAILGRLVTEEDVSNPTIPRVPSENAAIALAERGVRSSVVRLPPSVHGQGDHGFVPTLITVARTKGVAAYPGDGSNHWPAVHRLDAARLFRLALESAPAGSRLHGVAEEGVPVREIASVIVPVEEASGHFGFLGNFFSVDSTASSALTQRWLGWHPVQPGLLADLDQEYYFKSER